VRYFYTTNIIIRKENINQLAIDENERGKFKHLVYSPSSFVNV